MWQLKNNPLKVLQLFFILKRIFPNAEVSVDRTRKGFHVKAVGFEIKQIPLKKRVEIREYLGDDPLRVVFDKLKLSSGLTKLIETLFDAKTYFEGGHGKTYFTEEINPVALPWVSKLPSKKR